MTHICYAAFLDQAQLGYVYNQHLITCEFPTIHTQYQAVDIITLILQMGKPRHSALSYIPKIPKLLCGRKHSPSERDLTQKASGWLGCGQLSENAAYN